MQAVDGGLTPAAPQHYTSVVYFNTRGVDFFQTGMDTCCVDALTQTS